MTTEKKVKPLTINLNTAREQAEYYFNRECSPISLEILEKIEAEEGGHLCESILQPSESVLKEEYKGNGGKKGTGLSFEDWNDDREWYPMWSTLFKCPDFLSNQEYVDKLYECGIGVIENDYGTFLFIAGAGYDFYQAHWIPMFTEVLPWIQHEN